MYGIEGLLAGRTLVERYRVDAVVGRGGMGAVYRAHDLRLGREVAVKVITVAAADEDSHRRLRARFLREARAAAGLHHPNVVQVYDYGTDPSLQLDFLVMELLRGEDLATRISRSGAVAVPAAFQILWQAARGLAVGHRAGLVHRDVKPGNLFLEPGDRAGEVHVKVLDFGIADIGSEGDQTVTHLTVVGRSPFSPAYASPEQLRAETGLTPATDVFSLGAVGFHLLTGLRAFRSHDPRQMVVELSSAVATELPRVRGLSPEAREVLYRALSPDPRDRFPHAGAFAAALEPLAGHARPQSEADYAYVEEKRPPRRSPVEETVFLPDPEPTGTRAFTTARPRPSPGLQDLQPRAVSQTRLPAAPLSEALPEQARGSWLRRTARATWELCITAAAAIVFAGSWFWVTVGLQDNEMDPVYMGAAASVIATPWAIHRMLRRPGSIRFAVLASIAASLAVVILLREERLERVMGVLFAAQIACCMAAERLTRPREHDLFPD